MLRLGTASNGHLAIYIIVNLALVAIWYYTGAGFPWPVFPILFWA